VSDAFDMHVIVCVQDVLICMSWMQAGDASIQVIDVQAWPVLHKYNCLYNCSSKPKFVPSMTVSQHVRTYVIDVTYVARRLLRGM